MPIRFSRPALCCFPKEESRNLNHLVLIPFRLARDARGRFAKGRPGNPSGRPRGICNPRRRVPDLVARPLSAPALSKLLDRKPHLLRPLAVQLLPPPLKPIDPADRLGIDLSLLHTAEDLRELLPKVLAAIARGEITPAEGARLARRARTRWRAIRRLARFQRRLARGTAPRLDKMARPTCNAGATPASALRGDQRRRAAQPSTILRAAVRAASVPTLVDARISRAYGFR